MNTTDNPKRRTVMVIDDIPVNILLVKGMLARQDIDVVGAGSGPEAMEMMRHRRPDCVLMDILMPGMDGYQTTRAMRANPSTRDIPVIMLSALNSDDDIRRGMEAGANDFITKPFAQQTLIDRLNAQFDNHADRRKTQLLADVSHEIRTPLNAIVGFARLLADTDDRQLRHEYAHVIETNSELLTQLVDDIQDLAHMEEVTTVPADDAVDIGALMDDVRRTLAVILGGDSHVRLAVRQPDAHLRIRSNRNRLTQVLANLGTNAIKNTTQGSIDIGCAVEGRELRFFVADTGCGIPAGQTDRVFDRFVRLDTSKSGTGLGLAICKAIVERLGGRIWVDSEVGRGSTFSFTLPYVPA